MNMAHSKVLLCIFNIVLLFHFVNTNGLWQSYPTINGLTNQQHVALDINREDELTCSWNGVPKPGYLKWDIINPSSDQIIMTDHHNHTRDNGDGTYDLSLHSTLSVPSPSVFRVTLSCKVAAPADQWLPEITTAELLLPANPEYCDQKELYLRLGSSCLVSCDFGTFRVIGWLIGEDVDDRSPTILVENSRIQGPGYESGEYDMFQNGSLILNKVTLKHEQRFTARILRGTDVEHYTIEVKVYVLPVPLYPVVNGLTNQQHVVIDDYSVGPLNCAMDRVRRNIELELVFLDHVPQDVSLNSIHSSVNNTDGTYNVSLVSNLTVGSNLIGRLTLQCRVAGQMANYLPSVTLIDVLILSNGLWQSYPTVNGLTNQQHVVLDINREDELTCSWNGVPKPGYLKWDIINPSSDQIIMTDHHNHTRDNGDGTYDLSLHSTLSVPNPSVFRVTLSCKVAAPADQWLPEITTAELLLPANPFPVINGLTSQQHVVLDVQRTDVLTCSMHRVSQEVSLQWLIITADSSEDITMDDQLSRSDDEDGTVNITLNSTVTVTSLSINRVTLQCKVSGLPADSPQVLSTQVELLLPPNSKEDHSQSNGILWVLLIGISCIILIIALIICWTKPTRNNSRCKSSKRSQRKKSQRKKSQRKKNQPGVVMKTEETL